MKNIDKIRKLNNEELAFIIMCPNEFDDLFDEDKKACEQCKYSNCKECIKDWLNEEYKGGYEYLKESQEND